MKMSKIKSKLLAGTLCASIIFQSMSVGVLASENSDAAEMQTEELQDEETVQIDETEESIVFQTDEAVEDLASETGENEESMDFETGETDGASETATQTETSVEETSEIYSEEEGSIQIQTNYSIHISAVDSLDSMGDFFYLQLNGDGLDNLALDQLQYEVRDADATDVTYQCEYILAKKAPDGGKIVKFEKNNWTDSPHAITVTIRQKVEKPEEESERSDAQQSESRDSDNQADDEYKIIAYSDRIELKSGILYAAYNSVNDMLNLSVTSDLAGERISVVNADETKSYQLAIKNVDTYQVQDADGNPVKLDEDGLYFVKLGDIGKEKIVFGNYTSKVALLKKPSELRVYRPNGFYALLEYQVRNDETLKNEGGTNYYYFSSDFLNSKELNVKDEVYNIEILEGNSIVRFLENVTLTEVKWDGTFALRTKKDEPIEDGNVELYLGNSNYDVSKLTVTNAKEAPVFSYSNANIVSVELQDRDVDNMEYTAEISALSTGKTTVTIKVGDREESFSVEVKPAKKIEKLSFMNADDENIVITGIGKKADVVVLITPSEAIGSGEEIIASTSSTDIVEVERLEDTEDGCKRIFIKATGIGNAEVTIAVKDSTVVPLTCYVKVMQTSFSDAEKLVLKKNVGTVYAVTNVTGNRLGNVELPAGWSWVYPETLIKADDNATIKYYEAKYEADSYAPFTALLPVAVSQVTGIYITGDDELTNAHSGNYELHVKLKGYNVDLDKNDTFHNILNNLVKCTWSTDSMLEPDRSEGWNLSATAQKTDTIAEGVVRAKATVGENTFEDSFSVTILADHITQIDITPMSAIQKPVAFKYDENDKVVYVDEDNVSAASNTIKLSVTASMEDRLVNLQKGVLSWKVNDESLASLSESGDGTALLKVYGSGTIIVTVTAEDAGHTTAELPIEIRSFSPILETTNFTVNKYSEEGIELPLYAIEGNPITKINIDDANFRVDYADGSFRLSIANKDAYVSKTTVKTKIFIRTQMSSNAEKDISITVDIQKPKITFKLKSAPNIFYTDAETVYTVNSSYDIISITNAAERTTGFVVSDYDSRTKQLTIKTRGLTASNKDLFLSKKSDLCQVDILVKYKGYGTQAETIKITPKNVKPQYKVKDISALASDITYITSMYNTKDKSEVGLSADASVVSQTEGVKARQEGKRIQITYEGTKTKSYKLSIQDANWTSPLTVTGKISIEQKLKTLLGTESISLNMAHNIIDNGAVVIPVGVKNNTYEIERMVWTGTDRKTEQFLESNYLSVSYDKKGQRLLIGLNSGASAGVKTGTYKLAVSGYISKEDKEIELAQANLRITIVDASQKPTVKFSAKGTINLPDRANTSVVYTPKLTNMTANINKVETTGEYAGYFEVQLVDGKIEVKAVSDAPMSAKISYPLGLKMSFDNNTEVVSNVKIKPTNKLPKIKASLTKGVIYRASDNNVVWNLSNVSDFGEIESIEIVNSKTSDNFVLNSPDKHMIVVNLSPTVKRTIKKGKYTISYQVRLKGADVSAKPITLKMTITVK